LPAAYDIETAENKKAARKKRLNINTIKAIAPPEEGRWNPRRHASTSARQGRDQ
jgi:hypothetical protein